MNKSVFEIEVNDLFSGMFTDINLIIDFLINNSTDNEKSRSIFREEIESLKNTDSIRYVFKGIEYRISRFNLNEFLVHDILKKRIRNNDITGMKTLKQLIIDEFKESNDDQIPYSEKVENLITNELIKDCLLEFCFEYETTPGKARNHEKFIDYMIEKISCELWS